MFQGYHSPEEYKQYKKFIELGRRRQYVRPSRVMSAPADRWWVLIIRSNNLWLCFLSYSHYSNLKRIHMVRISLSKWTKGFQSKFIVLTIQCYHSIIWNYAVYSFRNGIDFDALLDLIADWLKSWFFIPVNLLGVLFLEKCNSIHLIWTFSIHFGWWQSYMRSKSKHL